MSNGVVTWAAINLANGASTSFTVTVTAPVSGNFTNSAASTSGTPDPDQSNNNGTLPPSRVTTTVTPIADVVVLKNGATNVPIGANFDYTITVSNRGPSVAANVVVTDYLPTNVAFVGAVPPAATVSNNVVTWPVLASLPAGGATNFTLTVKALAYGSFTNIASAFSSTSDPDPSNNNGTSIGSRVFTTVNMGQFGILAGTIVLNPQTGLFEQHVTVTNIGSSTVAAVRLLVGGLRAGVSLYNVTGTNSDLRPYVQYNSPLNPGRSVVFLLEFYVPDRHPFTNTLEAVAVLPASTGTNAGGGVVIDVKFMDLRIAGEPRFVIEFVSIPGRTYTVIYSDDNMATWKVATPSITANANRTQWYDDGPPKTESKPMAVPTRFYRVILAPAP